jgi:hypothetical protein
MASNSIGNLNVQLNLEIGRLQAQIDAANGKIRGLTRKMESDFSKAAKNINKALSSLGVGLSIGAVTAFSKSVLDLGGKITDLAAQAGIGTDAFQTFSNVAAESGVDAQQVANAFVQMRKNIEEAAEGSKVQAEALAALGLNADRLQALAPERQFEEIAKAIQSSTDKSKAFNASLEILGSKNAPKLTEVLQRLGTEGFAKLAKDVEGLRLSPDQLKTLDDAGDKLDRIWNSLKVMAGKVFVVAVDFVENKSAGPVGASLSNVSELGINDSDPMWQQIMAQNRADREMLQSTPEFKERAQMLEYANLAMEETVRTTADAAQAQAAFNRQIVEGEKLSEAQGKRVDARALKSADDRIRSALLGPSDRERANREARNKGLTGMFADGESVTEANLNPLELYNKELSRLVDLKNAGAISAETYDRAVRKEGESYQKAQTNAAAYTGTLEDLEEPLSRFEQVNSQMWENIADRTGEALTDMLLDGEAKFKDFAGSVARMIAETALRLAIINPIMNGVFGLSGASALPSLFGARASGGPMSAGGSYLVGESGPEIVTPTANSMVTPNHAIAGMGSAGNTYVIDARGADAGAVDRIEATLIRLAGPGVTEKRAMGAVANERKRGGGLGRAFGA